MQNKHYFISNTLIFVINILIFWYRIVNTPFSISKIKKNIEKTFANGFLQKKF